VLDAARESLKRGRAARDEVHACYNGTYYEGMRHCEIIRDWIEPLEWYGGLTRRERRLIQAYLYMSRDTRARRTP
jgi:hypothetical protein